MTAKPVTAGSPAGRPDSHRAGQVDISGDFPILDRSVNGQPLVYLDNAATTQKPRQVLEAIRNYYQRFNSNVHRAAHAMADEATAAFEGAREKVRAFVGAADSREIIFTRGTTEASATKRFSTPLTRQCWSTTAMGSLSGPILQVPETWRAVPTVLRM